MAYTRVNWQDGPSGGTPVSAANLNVMDAGIKAAHDVLDAASSAASANTLIRRDANGRAQVAAPNASADIATKEYVDNRLPAGVIVMWSGSIASIPSGWRLCDGTGGTPDLRDRFIVGAGNSYSPGNAGGSSTHTHTFSGTTSQSVGGTVPAGLGSGASPQLTHRHDFSGTTSSADSRPPYYALAFIMKTA